MTPAITRRARRKQLETFTLVLYGWVLLNTHIVSSWGCFRPAPEASHPTQKQSPALEFCPANPWSAPQVCDFVANTAASAKQVGRLAPHASVTCPEGPTSAPCRFAPSACLLSEQSQRTCPKARKQLDAASELRTCRLLHSEHRVSFHLSPSFWIHKLQGLGVLLQRQRISVQYRSRT